MAATKILPGVDELQRRVNRGETRAAIAREFGVTRGAVALALLRAGKEPGQVRYNDLIPWRVRKAHLRQYAAKMLRLEGRVRNGLPINDDDAGRLASWKQSLKDNDDSVIMYFAEHDCPYCEGSGGFHPVRRIDALKKFGQPAEGFDTELIFVTDNQAREINSRNT